MSKLEYLKISHFRGVESFEQRFCNGITCIIGRGDSGKSTILEAISLLFAQSWTIRLNDSDFYECNIDNPIIIEGTVSGLPHELITKYDNHVRGILPDGKLIDDMESDEAKESEHVLSIRLTIKRDLEPLWEVVSNNGEDPTSIKAVDRGKINVYAVTDYTDRHFSMNKGTPLYSLYKQLKGYVVEDTSNTVLDIVRNAKKAFDKTVGDSFNEVVSVVKVKAEELGIALNKMNANLDHSDIAINENKVSIHENGIPFRLKGKGSKRLLSLAIQLALTEPSGVILIDEVEQGLEPDRVRHLVNVLSKYTDRQIIITTHSSNVIVEIPCDSIYIMRKGARVLMHVEGDVQGCVRKNPEAFFARKVIVCEGPTEIGLCRALNQFRIKENMMSLACLGVGMVNGHGSELEKYVLGFNALGFKTALLCDSDDKNINYLKPTIKTKGVLVVDCEDDLAIEQQIFKEVNWDMVRDIVALYYKISQDEGLTEDQAKQRVFSQVHAQLGKPKEHYYEQWLDEDNIELRSAFGAAAKKDKGWFKTEGKASALITIILPLIKDPKNKSHIKQEFEMLSNWIDA
ncbi:MAG: AAA family ATPase [Bacteroidales bacterium]|nr:AAA family ATPase [Bacteroidales bacterium]